MSRTEDREAVLCCFSFDGSDSGIYSCGLGLGGSTLWVRFDIKVHVQPFHLVGRSGEIVDYCFIL